MNNFGDIFLGKPIEYWLELEHYNKENMYEELISENAKMRMELGRLYIVEYKYNDLVTSLQQIGYHIREQE